MHKSALLLKITALAVFMMATPSTWAGMVTLNFEGALTYASDPTGVLPFDIPATGTRATYSATVDTDSLGNPYPLGYLVSNIELIFSGQQFTDPGALSILDDFPTQYSPALKDSGAYADLWNIYSITNINSSQPYLHDFGVVFANTADATPIAPLDAGSTFVIPDLADWDMAEIYYAVGEATPSVLGTEFTTLGAVRFEIDSISVSEVPIPAALWLFGSALLGLAGCKRFSPPR